MIDTHAHLYAEEFDHDRDAMIQRAKDAGVQKIILPNVDSSSLHRMLALESQQSGYCYAAIGVHPTSINNNYEAELDLVRTELLRRPWIAIGEIGIDLYWDKTYLEQQKIAFRQQLAWSLEFDLPVIIHVRDSFAETMSVLNEFRGKGLRGVFHSFTGNKEEALSVIAFKGFLLGINGIVTFKNAGLAESLSDISPEYLLLETDAPYLSPVPYRGKRNESSYLQLITEKVAVQVGCTFNELTGITTRNAQKLFRL
jgi:TatD DNase family protein